MTIDFYYFAGSSQCQVIQMVAAALGVELNLIPTNLMAGDQLKPEFIAINPQHTIPTLVDDGFALWETRAILVYLVEKYGRSGAAGHDALYPAADPKQRARINQRLYFDMGSMYKAFSDAYYASFYADAPPTEEQMKKVDAAFGFLNTFLEGEKFVAGGEERSVADYALYATVSLFEKIGGYEVGKHENVAAWLKRERAEIVGEKFSSEGLALLAGYVAKHKAEKK